MEDRLTPVYPTTEGVQQGRLRRLVAEALGMLRREAPTELIPAKVLDRTDLPPLAEAVEYLHRPPPGYQLGVALQRFSLAAPDVKKNFLDACAHCVLHDKQVTLQEAELLRTVAYALDIPLPPFLKTFDD